MVTGKLDDMKEQIQTYSTIASYFASVTTKATTATSDTVTDDTTAETVESAST